MTKGDIDFPRLLTLVILAIIALGAAVYICVLTVVAGK